jgi:ADP-ribosylarginine hydrolase
MTDINEKISASLVLGSYLDTLGFCNGKWEFNFNLQLKTLKDAMVVNYEIINSFFSYGGFNIDISSWLASDDTIMMIATMNACKKGGSLKNFMNEYIQILPQLEDKKRVSGITTLNSLRILAKHHDIKKIHYSETMGGNGAAMRTHYIGIHFKDIKKIIEVSIMASRLTHNYPIGFLGGMTTAIFTHYAINNIEPWKWCDLLLKLEKDGIIDNVMKNTDIYDNYMKDKDEFWEPWYKFKERRVDIFYTRTSEFIFGADRFNDLLNIFNEKNEINYNRFGGSGVECTIIALDSLLLSILPRNMKHELDLSNPKEYIYSWQNLVFLSTLHFGDNDTIGAIAGMWFGALRGYDGVSKKIINMLEFKEKLL